MNSQLASFFREKKGKMVNLISLRPCAMSSANSMVMAVDSERCLLVGRPHEHSACAANLLPGTLTSTVVFSSLFSHYFLSWQCFCFPAACVCVAFSLGPFRVALFCYSRPNPAILIANFLVQLFLLSNWFCCMFGLL